jgi:membrane fusion protein, copper/silver efflux system
MNTNPRHTAIATVILFAALIPLGCRGKNNATTAEHQDSTVTGQTGDIAYYTCPMHPSIRSQKPGQCPICGMTLVPVTQEELHTGTITLTAERRQEIGVRTAPAEMKSIHKT